MRQSYSNRLYLYIPIYFRLRFTGVEEELLYYGLMDTETASVVDLPGTEMIPP